MIGLLLMLSSSVALSESGEPIVSVESGVEIIEVYGEHALRQARAALIREMEGMGYTPIERRGELRFRPPSRWMGRVTFTRDGQLLFSRPLVTFDKGSLVGATYDSGASVGVDDALNNSESLTVSSSVEERVFSRDNPATTVVPQARFWLRPSSEVMDAVELRVREGVEDERRQYLYVIWRTQMADTLASLGQRLDALWETGTPLNGVDIIEPGDARRDAIVEYWATRPEGVDGDMVADAVSRYLRQVVQDSDWRVTEPQWRTANARRGDGRQLDLGGVDGAPIRWPVRELLEPQGEGDSR